MGWNQPGDRRVPGGAMPRRGRCRLRQRSWQGPGAGRRSPARRAERRRAPWGRHANLNVTGLPADTSLLRRCGLDAKKSATPAPPRVPGPIRHGRSEGHGRRRRLGRPSAPGKATDSVRNANSPRHRAAGHPGLPTPRRTGVGVRAGHGDDVPSTTTRKRRPGPEQARLSAGGPSTSETRRRRDRPPHSLSPFSHSTRRTVVAAGQRRPGGGHRMGANAGRQGRPRTSRAGPSTGTARGRPSATTCPPSALISTLSMHRTP
jgi:hypothetical protein